jgi:Astacin (Peptidase family M12A)
MQNIRSLVDNPLRAVVVVGDRFRWLQELVPYEINPNLPNQHCISDAIRDWDQRTSIRIVRHNGTSASQYLNYILFEDQCACWSFVGILGSREIISSCARYSTGDVIHEIGHANGLWHEQTREDCDTWLRIDWHKMDSDQRCNFDQHITDGDNVFCTRNKC